MPVKSTSQWIVTPNAGFDALQYEASVAIPDLKETQCLVVVIGSKVTEFQVGDKVSILFMQDHLDGIITPQIRQSTLGSQRDGVLRQYGIFEETGLVTLPKSLSYIEGSTLPCAAVTAWNCLFGLKSNPLQKGDIVLTQGTGGVSLFAIQFALAIGATVIVTTSTVEKEQKLKALGVCHVINYKSDPNWGETAKSITPDGLGVHHVIEVGGESTIPQTMKAIRPEGVVSMIGFLGGKMNNQTSFSLIQQQLCIVRGMNVGSRKLFCEMNSFIDSKGIKPILSDQTFNFQAAKEAYKYMDLQDFWANMFSDIKADDLMHIESITPKSENLEDKNADALQLEQISIDPKVERSLNRKFDFRILPCLFLIYFFSFMDRSSIGNASIAGLNADLKLEGKAFETALALFFVVYLIVDIPAGWVFKSIGPRYFLSLSIFCFGICTICLGFVTTASQLYAVRCLLGFCEGGLTPCLYLYIALFYKHTGIQKRMAWFYTAAPLSGAIGGLLASGLGKINVGRFKAWPWIFFIEGALTLLVRIFCFLRLPNFPSQTRGLTDAELQLARVRGGAIGNGINIDQEKEKFSWNKVRDGFLDWNTIILSLAAIGSYCNIYAYGLFSPTIIKTFGYSTIHSQLLSVAPYIFAILCVLFCGYLFDYLHLRGPFMIGACILQAVGWIINIAAKSNTATYFGCFLIAGGVFSGINLMASWLTENLQPHYVRATGISLSVTMGTCGGIIATFTYMDTGSNVGNWVQLGMCILSAICAGFLMWKNNAENKLRQRGGRDYRLHNASSPEQLGSRHPAFVLSL
ncbi:hypothetical protein B7463_g11452, partial [Scytalidium lignicola]